MRLPFLLMSYFGYLITPEYGLGDIFLFQLPESLVVRRLHVEADGFR